LIPARVLVLMILLVGGLLLGHLAGPSQAWIGALLTILTEGGLACLVVIAAGGYGWKITRWLAGRSVPRSLVVFTGCGLGLWMLSSAVLVVGMAFTGALKGWLWWPVVALGVVLAGWQGRKAMESWQMPNRFDGRALIWVALSLAAAIWLAGATLMPGLMFTADRYDVLEYHLQVPREFFAAQHIGQLRHNCYSHYPLGVEMLFLLAMCLRNGAYEGMYLAKMLHGAFGVLAVGVVFAALKRDDDPRGRFSAGILATLPIVIGLGWLAMVELAAVFYTVLAVLWLRRWLSDGRAGNALCIGVAIGAACATKYLSVGLVAGPILATMVVMALAKRPILGRMAHVPVAAIVCVLLMAPWLLRNYSTTGNPVFPLATTVFGRGHWSAQSQQRWIDGHRPGSHAPVPAPEGWQSAETPGRIELLYDNLMVAEDLSPLTLLLAGVAVCMFVAAGSTTTLWDWSLLVVFGLQVAVWTAFTHEMPTRFLAPAMGPVSLLAGAALAKVFCLRRNPFKQGGGKAQDTGWGRPVAVALISLTLAVNLITTYLMYQKRTEHLPASQAFHGQGGSEMAMVQYLHTHAGVPLDARFMLVGESRCWYWPIDSLYATAFDEHPIAKMIEDGRTADEMLATLKGEGITHLAVGWGELWRLAVTYGYPASLTEGLFEDWSLGQSPGLGVLDQFEAMGAKRLAGLDDVQFRAYLPWDISKGSLMWPQLTVYAMPWTPLAITPDTMPASAPSTQATSSGS